MLAISIPVTVSKEGPSSPSGEVSILKNKVKKLEEELRRVHMNHFSIVKHLETALELARTWIDSSKWGPGPTTRSARTTRKQNLFLANVLRKASELTETLTTNTKSKSGRVDYSDGHNRLMPPDSKFTGMRHGIPSMKNTVSNLNSRTTSISESMPVTSTSRIIGLRKEKRRLGVAEEWDPHKTEQLTSVMKKRSLPRRMGELTPDCNSEVGDILSESIPGNVDSKALMPSVIQPEPGQENKEEKEREKEKIMHSKSYQLANIENSVTKLLDSVERRSLVKRYESKVVRLRDYGMFANEGEMQSGLDWSSKIMEEEIRMSSLDDMREHSALSGTQLLSSSKLSKRSIISRISFK